MNKKNWKEETLRFKIIGFKKFPNSEQINDCIAINEDGEEFSIDPFVGQAFDYEQREHLINEWWEAEGRWFEDKKNNSPICFLPRENHFKKLNNSHKEI